ncbi:uncharacterized protein LOC132179848 [Corylus avellana]|nr:uncharacterized protein LOC132179848 [Corylus avellana]
MAALFMAANSAAKRISGGKVRILPDSEGGREEVGAAAEESGSRLSLEGVDEVFASPEFKFRLSVCRSRKPGLETITEEPIRSR